VESLFLSRSFFLCSGVFGAGFLGGLSSFGTFIGSISVDFLFALDSVGFVSTDFTSLTLTPLFF